VADFRSIFHPKPLMKDFRLHFYIYGGRGEGSRKRQNPEKDFKKVFASLMFLMRYRRYNKKGGKHCPNLSSSTLPISYAAIYMQL